MAYYFLLSPQLLAQQQLLPANQQQLLAQQLIQSQQLQQGEELIQQRSDAIDLTDEEVEEKKFKVEPRHDIYAQYENAAQHHIASWEQQHHHQPAQQTLHQSIPSGHHQYQTIEQNEVWHSGSEPTTSDECILPEENISNYETIIETEEIIEDHSSSQIDEHLETQIFEPELNQTSQKEKSLHDYIERYPSKCGEIYLNKAKQYKFKCHYCKSVIDGIQKYVTHVTESHFPYNTDVHDVKIGEIDAEKCGNVFMSNVCSFLYICTVCNKPFEEFQQFSKHINDYHLNILIGNPKTFLDAFQLFAKKMEEKTEFVNENSIHKSASKVVRGSRTLKEARDNSAPIRSQPKSQPQKCDLCNYQCRTLKQLAKHNEIHVLENPRLQQQQQLQQSQIQNQQPQQFQQHNIYNPAYVNYTRTVDADEGRIATEFILS